MNKRGQTIKLYIAGDDLKNVEQGFSTGTLAVLDNMIIIRSRSVL